MTLQYWLCVAITAISAFVSLGFSIVGYRNSNSESRVGFMYALARSLALAVVAVVALFTTSVPFAACIAVAMVLVQAADAVVGWRTHDAMKTYGPAVTAIANAAALVWMLTSS